LLGEWERDPSMDHPSDVGESQTIQGKKNLYDLVTFSLSNGN